MWKVLWTYTHVLMNKKNVRTEWAKCLSWEERGEEKTNLARSDDVASHERKFLYNLEQQQKKFSSFQTQKSGGSKRLKKK